MNATSGENNQGWNQERMNPSSGEITGVETTKPNKFIMGIARRILLLIPVLALVHAMTIQETAVVKS